MNSNELPVLDTNKAADFIQSKILSNYNEFVSIDFIKTILDYEEEYMESIGIIETKDGD
jgi:hypothetical protein